MRIVTLDFETYFDDDYTLKKLTTENYIRDPRFEAHGAAVHEGDQTRWLSPQKLRTQCKAWRGSTAYGNPLVMICHHAHFDGLILSHHFNYRPDFWIDTLSMARVLFDQDKRNDLGSLAERFGLSPKTVPYQEMKGKHWHEMTPELQAKVASGGCHDAVLTHRIADWMIGGGHPAVPYPFPTSELKVVDLTVRMFTEPALVGNPEKLGQAWYAERDAKAELFKRLGVTAGQLRKDDEFAVMLEDLGVDVPTKITNKGNEKFAFAKSDYFMQDLLTSEDEDVALLAEARLAAQSSIYRSRVERIGDAATRGPLPVYLAYAAAHTRRWGGGDRSNWQNWPRPDPSRPEKGALKKAVQAP